MPIQELSMMKVFPPPPPPPAWGGEQLIPPPMVGEVRWGAFIYEADHVP